MTNIEIKRDGKGKIWSHVRKKWLAETPEETVRQEYLIVLVNDYHFSIDQISEELDLTGRGSASARADFVLWRTVKDKANNMAPFIIVECKSDNVTIKPADYTQGEHYARHANAPFFVTHNSRETRYWRVKKDRLPGYTEEIENIPHGNSTDKEIEELLSKLRAFKEKEFADLLHQCHNIIRNREKKDPAAAFDEIAKVLFIKVYVERQLLTRRSKENLFTVDVLNRQIADNPLDTLFQETKRAYATDKIFGDDERINLKPATGEEIVRKLEKYNLSDTSEDVKGVAFERFLGRTFRGEIGQFFTPRAIVEFMVHMVDPQEGEIACDPASGSGGFLIRIFEIVREKILADADREYAEFKQILEADTALSEEERAKKLKTKFDDVQRQIDQKVPNSRTWNLSNRCIYGTDANDRMARTSKMNMIMHGDGHGGVHHHDGFLNVNGIFEGRFDIILTNPPFGANVEPTDKILEADLAVNPLAEQRYLDEYGDLYLESQARVKAALNKPIASLFELPKSEKAKIKTEVLFIERCLDLLKPGGRMGIVLPEGIFNNPSLSYVREFVEDRAFLRAVVSLPPETFISSGASVKCSLLFLQKFTAEEQERFEAIRKAASAEIEAELRPEIVEEVRRLESAIDDAKSKRNSKLRTEFQTKLREYKTAMIATILAKSRRKAKENFNYQVFMFEAERVGITATGEEDKNELYPNKNQPNNDKTCLELYREFLKSNKKMRNDVNSKDNAKIISVDSVKSLSDMNALKASYAKSDQWDIKSGRAALFIEANPSFVRLGDYIEECNETIKPFEFPDKQWPVYGVNNSDGVFLNGFQQGATFNAPYKIIRKDWFFHNPTRANVGSLGKVPDVPEDAITSPEYQVWRITKGFIPEYMELILRTEFFLALVAFNRVGGVKQRMYFDNLAEIRIPYISLDEQRQELESRHELLEKIRVARAGIAVQKAALERKFLSLTRILEG